MNDIDYGQQVIRKDEVYYSFSLRCGGNTRLRDEP